MAAGPNNFINERTSLLQTSNAPLSVEFEQFQWQIMHCSAYATVP